MTENPEPKFCCSLWLYYIRFPKTVVNKMKIKMTKFLNTSYRWGISRWRAVPAPESRISAVSDLFACFANSVANKS